MNLRFQTGLVGRPKRGTKKEEQVYMGDLSSI